jgi:hypothetical protein
LYVVLYELLKQGNDHEIKFHEIKSCVFHKLKTFTKLLTRAKVVLSQDGKFKKIYDIIQEIETLNNALNSFDLMIVLVAIKFFRKSLNNALNTFDFMIKVCGL